MKTFASDIHALLQRLVSEETPNLSKYDKDLLSHLEVALYNLLVAENGLESVCSGQQKLATALEFFQNNLSDSFGVKPPLY